MSTEINIIIIFLEGKIDFLDYHNEWFYDDGFLYMWSEDGTDLPA